ncbi:hypothetical protein HXX76_011464 [Chlamydomonas incerta]|uniref:DAGKc domain-containing protein n=1 Tax=Chlamydomonas incerta TaxID=51695 RepID=A0A835SSA8_CHLIN|nr:hypothetical protein HXX76_011464 [Chlamydomonas incerta]|eukprot:KAG2428763.1 hypothetical protein HXX76_011464 [Chlamydomonas incerta]
MASKAASASSATAVKPPATEPEYQERKPSRDLDAELAASLSSRRRQAAAAAPAAPEGELAPEAAATRGSAAAAKGRRLAVILHGKRADEADVRAAVKAARLEGVRLDVKVTWESGDVARFVKDIVRDRSADTIVAAGGDGTLNEVVAALIKCKAPRSIAVGLLPMGTSNDFAAVTGLPQDLDGALRLCCRSDNLHPIDVGLLNGEVFMNTATLGASSELGSETSHEAKQLLGPAAYLVKGVARLVGYTAVPVRMRFPKPPPQNQNQASSAVPAPAAASGGGRAAGEGSSAGGAGSSAGDAATAEQPSATAPVQQREERAPKQDKIKPGKTMEIRADVLNLTAGNSRQLASMVQACPDALLDDGLLDVTYVTGGAAAGATSLMGQILTRGLDAAEPDNVHMLRVPWLELELLDDNPDTAWPGNRDGEPVPPGRKFLLEALPRRVAMHLPPAAQALLVAGADPRLNPPIIAINRLRKGAVKAMLSQVTRFKRINPFSPPWWQAAALGLLGRAPELLLAFGAGWWLAGRRSRTSTRTGATGAEGREVLGASDRQEKRKVRSAGGGGGGTRAGARSWTWWGLRRGGGTAAEEAPAPVGRTADTHGRLGHPVGAAALVPAASA